MKKACTVFDKILHPPKFVLFAISPVVFAALIYIFICDKQQNATAYTVYGMSAYCLTVIIIFLTEQFKVLKSFITGKINSTRFGKKYIGDIAFRGKVNLFQGMTANFLYVIFRLITGIRYASTWFISIAIYYFVLGIIKLYLILGYRRKSDKNELIYYKRSALMLFLLNIPMGGMIALTVVTNSGYNYPGYIIYVSALYCFYMLICAVINLVKYRKLGSPILTAAKILNFIAALMSILGLQTAMIAEFSTEGEFFRIIMNGAVGTAIWLSVILTAIYMLYKSNKMNNEVRRDEQVGK